MIPPELAAAIDALITRALPSGGANETPRCLQVFATSALFEYFLAPDGVVYEVDLDRWQRYERVESADLARETYAAAAARFPELAALAGCDPAAPPRTFEDALAYAGKVIAAWDDADPKGTTLVACAISNAGARRLAARSVTAAERDGVLDRLRRDHPIGATLGPLVWHLEIISGLNIHDATSHRASYLRPNEVSRVRSSRSIEIVDEHGGVKRLVDDVDTAVASRCARDLANDLERPHDDNGTVDANASELALVRACRTLATRLVEVPGYQVQRELRVSVAGVEIVIDDGAVVLVVNGLRHRLFAPAADGWWHSRTKAYLEHCWVIQDIVRAVGPVP